MASPELRLDMTLFGLFVIEVNSSMPGMQDSFALPGKAMSGSRRRFEGSEVIGGPSALSISGNRQAASVLSEAAKNLRIPRARTASCSWSRRSASSVRYDQPLAARRVANVDLPLPDSPIIKAPIFVFGSTTPRSEEHTSELQSPDHIVCRLMLEIKK